MPHKRRQPKPPRPQDVARYDSLGMAIFHALNLADAASLTPVDAVFGTVRTVLKMIQVRSHPTPPLRLYVLGSHDIYLGHLDQRAGLR